MIFDFSDLCLAKVEDNSPQVGNLKFYRDKIEKVGFVMTTKRTTILVFFILNQPFNNIDELWIGLKKNHKISKATVSSTLNFLCGAGIIEKFYKNSKAASYRLVEN